MDIEKVEKILTSEKLNQSQKNLLIMLYGCDMKGTQVNPRQLSSKMNLSYNNVTINIRDSVKMGILAVTGVGGRAGKHYNINWSAL